MNIKKCNKCGWEYPGEWPGRTCKFCRTTLTMGYCRICGKWSTNIDCGRCRECRTEEHRRNTARRRDEAAQQYKEWLESIASIPKPYKTLTEEQWLEACSHFGGCAYCGKDAIDTRSMFVPFKEGGRYCAWNIIPACERCENLQKQVQNPFSRMNQYLNRDRKSITKKYDMSLEKLQRIVDYLRSKMED